MLYILQGILFGPVNLFMLRVDILVPQAEEYVKNVKVNIKDDTKNSLYQNSLKKY